MLQANLRNHDIKAIKKHFADAGVDPNTVFVDPVTGHLTEPANVTVEMNDSTRTFVDLLSTALVNDNDNFPYVHTFDDGNSMIFEMIAYKFAKAVDSIEQMFENQEAIKALAMMEPHFDFWREQSYTVQHAVYNLAKQYALDARVKYVSMNRLLVTFTMVNGTEINVVLSQFDLLMALRDKNIAKYLRILLAYNLFEATPDYSVSVNPSQDKAIRRLMRHSLADELSRALANNDGNIRCYAE